MEQIVDRLKSERCHDSTRKTYLTVWHIFNKFFVSLDYRPRKWEDRIVLFVAFLIEVKGLKSSTIRSYLSAIRAILWENEIELNEDAVLLSALIRACKLKNDTIVARLPIHKDLLRLIIQECKIYFTNERQQPFLGKLYIALFLTAYYGLLRIGEVTQGQHCLMAKDVRIGVNKKKMLFLLHTSKTHGKGNKPQRIKITSIPLGNKTNKRTVEDHCPYEALNIYLQSRPRAKANDEQFFVFRDNTPVQPQHARHILSLMLRRLGLNEKLYNFHSYRIGRSSDLMKMGVSVETIKKIGRWRSNSVFVYLRD